MTATTEAGLRAAAETEIARVVGFAQGTVGVAALHLESGRALAHNNAEPFPMASTVKVPVAVAILDMVDRGALSLATQLEVALAELNPSGPIGEEFRHPGVSLSVFNILEPMITRSDNTATDVLFRAAGGPAAVERHMRSLGITEMRISRNVRDLLLVLYGVPDPGPDTALIERMRAVSATELAAMRTRAHSRNPAYSDDPRDQATPRAMLELLRRIAQADGVSPAARDVLLPIMGRTSTGVRRIAGRLPQGVAVANKTGSAAGTTNDAGLVTLPGGRGRLALVVYVKASALAPAEREDVIADIARLVYDYFVITTPGQ
jgi:beta-lactamase class A